MMPGRERTRDRLKRLVFRNQTASSAPILPTEPASTRPDQQTDTISLDPPSLDISRRSISPNQDVHLSISTSGEPQNTGLTTSSNHEVQSPKDSIGPSWPTIEMERPPVPPELEVHLS